MYKNELTVELLTENGNKITEFSKDGRTFIEGRKGSKYKIKIVNHTGSKIKTIISVDGLDVLTGKRAIPNSGGYVLNAWDTLILDGWRISPNQIREFFFTSEKNSYNAKTGNDTNNLGVIGVLAYKEYQAPVVTYRSIFDNVNLDGGSHYSFADSGYLNNTTNRVETLYRASSSSLTPKMPLKARSVGTGMGEVKESRVTTVHATWVQIEFAHIELFYKSRKELEAMGITVAPVKEKPLPSAFAGYCKQV